MSISCTRRLQNSRPTISRSWTPPTAQIEGLKSTVASLQKIVDDLQAAQKKTIEDQKKKAEPPPARDAPAAKEGAK